MVRVPALQAAYGCYALAFVAIAFSTVVGFAAFLGVALALAGAIVFAFTEDDVPKWSGLALLAYVAFTLVSFVLASSVTIKGGYFANGAPPAFAQGLFLLLVGALPLLLAASALVASWEREMPVRVLLLAALVMLLAAISISAFYHPTGDVPEGNYDQATKNRLAAEDAQRKLDVESRIETGLVVAGGLAGALGTAWAAARPDEYA